MRAGQNLVKRALGVLCNELHASIVDCLQRIFLADELASYYGATLEIATHRAKAFASRSLNLRNL